MQIFLLGRYLEFSRCGGLGRGKICRGVIRGFRTEKREKCARVLAARQALSLKKWPEFRRSGKQKELRANKLSRFPNLVATFSRH